MSLALIIDGYNFIRQSEAQHFLDASSLEEARRILIERLAAYHARRGYTIVVVFDGWGGLNPQCTTYRYKGIEVVYTARGQTADEWIVQRVKRVNYGAVISSDRKIQQHVERMGLVAIDSPTFEQKMEMVLAGTNDVQLRGEGSYNYPPKKVSAYRLSKREKKRWAIIKKL